jgi:hypothetical protein
MGELEGGAVDGVHVGLLRLIDVDWAIHHLSHCLASKSKI